MSTFFIVLLVIVALVFIWAISIYNTLIGLIEAINNNKKQIDIQLDRRFKVFESLIESVKKYMDYEKTTLKDVVALRNQAQEAKASGNEQARMDAENGISKIASGLNLVFEQYPDLKASQNVMQLQEEIVNTENKLAYSKQAYNDSIERYNAKKKSFFESIVVSLFAASLDKEFVYWGLSDEQVQAKEEYTVKL
ncbi:LemA family protein [Legionella worsleiensis]|uniref:LemA protein n=1 Tax=Legionella worsleiensis TaxID=45076 RepID=A0A0W1AKG8_9GAMM|nr:LemA family protein [Legionella worsleiensis]KTD81667.1 LemA protein [Legionella worsleiensis]STY31923.1 LemA protein [Legionella worsleiensis]